MSDQQPEIYSITQNKDTIGLYIGSEHRLWTGKAEILSYSLQVVCDLFFMYIC